MKATIIIETINNAAFEDNGANETGWILKNLANLLLSDGCVEKSNKNLYDMNGNQVGFITIK